MRKIDTELTEQEHTALFDLLVEGLRVAKFQWLMDRDTNNTQIELIHLASRKIEMPLDFDDLGEEG